LISHGFPPLGGVKQGRGGKTSYLRAKCSITRKESTYALWIGTKIDDLVTLDDLELYKFEFLENFSGFRRFRTQQQLNVWIQTSIVSDNGATTL